MKAIADMADTVIELKMVRLLPAQNMLNKRSAKNLNCKSKHKYEF